VGISDVTMTTLHQALRGLSARQRSTADNVANLETPGFTASRVDFESSLQSALKQGDPQTSTVAQLMSDDPARQDGNNVNLDDETVSMIDTNLKYSTVVEGLNAKFRLLRSAIGA
jgi:flagellar basal-body rod protein FlgB